MMGKRGKRQYYTLVAGLGLVALGALALAGCSPAATVTQTVTATATVTATVSLEEIQRAAAQQAADALVRNEATFVFDGIEDTLQLAETRRFDVAGYYLWEFVYTFDSRHAGYGDRTGQALAQVITPHEVVVNVEKGEVKSAMMDGKWNMLTQQREYSQEETQAAAEAFVKSEGTYAFDGMPETFVVRKVSTTGEEARWLVVIEFSSAHGGYGDRTGQIVTEAITPHSVQLFVERAVVVEAVMDGRWDMLASGLVVSEDLSRQTAEDWVRQEATYAFDGIPETLKLESTMAFSGLYGWRFTFTFDSRHAGTGDRTGQVLAEVITPHRLEISVVEGRVNRAVLDGELIFEAVLSPVAS